MDTTTTSRDFANISQRAAASYLKSLAEPGLGAEGELHAFFKALYINLYEHPELFGLPLDADTSIAENEPDAKEKKHAVKRLLDKPKVMIAAGLDFLMLAGSREIWRARRCCSAVIKLPSNRRRSVRNSSRG